MISNGSIFSSDYSPPSIEDIKALKGGKKKKIQAFISALSKKISSIKEAFNSSSPTPQELIQVFNHLEKNQKSFFHIV